MTSKNFIAWSYIISLLAFFFALWICVINFQEIINRLNGQNTFYSQRATLTDNEAVIYFGIWTLILILFSFLSLYNLIKMKFKPALIFGVIIFLLILCSIYIDTLFYHALV